MGSGRTGWRARIRQGGLLRTHLKGCREAAGVVAGRWVGVWRKVGGRGHGAGDCLSEMGCSA